MKEIEDEITRLKSTGVNVDKLSFVGYSLGGIVGRFTVGLLYHKGYFNKIKPMVRPTRTSLEHLLTSAVIHNLRHTSSRRTIPITWLQRSFLERTWC
jgi:Putative serine esterase (DUF676)